MTDQLTNRKRGPSPRFRKPARTKMFSIVFMLHYIEISAEQPSTSIVGHQSTSSFSPERRPSTSREEPQPSTSREEPQPSTSCEETQHSTSGQSLSGSDYVLQELAPVELHSDADLKGILVSLLYY